MILVFEILCYLLLSYSQIFIKCSFQRNILFLHRFQLLQFSFLVILKLLDNLCICTQLIFKFFILLFKYIAMRMFQNINFMNHLWNFLIMQVINIGDLVALLDHEGTELLLLNFIFGSKNQEFFIIFFQLLIFDLWFIDFSFRFFFFFLWLSHHHNRCWRYLWCPLYLPL